MTTFRDHIFCGLPVEFQPTARLFEVAQILSLTYIDLNDIPFSAISEWPCNIVVEIDNKPSLVTLGTCFLVLAVEALPTILPVESHNILDFRLKSARFAIRVIQESSHQQSLQSVATNVASVLDQTAAVVLSTKRLRDDTVTTVLAPQLPPSTSDEEPQVKKLAQNPPRVVIQTGSKYLITRTNIIRMKCVTTNNQKMETELESHIISDLTPSQGEWHFVTKMKAAFSHFFSKHFQTQI